MMSILPGDALVNYIFPNNAQVWWALPIVIYPYITGLMAGAFVLSSLHHLFRVKEFRPIGNFALIAAFCFGLFAGVPLLFHLGQPQRAAEIFMTPHLTSAMSIFGYVWAGYMVLLMIEIWLIYRPYFIRMADATTGLMGVVWGALTLGVRTYHPDSAEVDRKLTVILAGIGLPWACLLHGYVGFIFGSVKAMAWWATPLQPIIFLLSAMVSGMAMLMLMYTVIKWRRHEPYDYVMVKKFMVYLWATFVLAFTLEMLELATIIYERGWHWSQVGPLLRGPLFESFVIGQVLILSVVPLFLLGYVALSKLAGRALFYLANLCSLMLVLQVLFMRFNVVIGGQLISKSERGFVDFEWEFLTKEGVLAVAMILAAPFVVYYVISRFIPIFNDPAEATSSDTG
ncbi:MAG: NrfD/PsrC family molybdoenzyme membrane anchor subunit [Rhodospirillales bacterium]